MVQNSIAREITFELEADATPIALELDLPPRHSPPFVTGGGRFDGKVSIRAPEPDPCPYCGATGWVTDRTGATCAHCGAPARCLLLMAAPPATAVQHSAPSLGEALLDAVAWIPFGFWKRVPVYAFLALVLGNGCRCGGLAASTNAALAALVAIGVAGIVLSLQRNP